MTTTRSYVWTLKPREDEHLEDLSRRAHKVLAWACDGDKRVECQGVHGEAMGIVQIRFAVTGRDMWATGQISQDIINVVTMRLRNPADLDLSKEKPPVHRSRGYKHGRAKRINHAYGAGERATDLSRNLPENP